MTAGAERWGVLLGIAYDGSAFSGWAAQRDVRTVEDTVRGAIKALDPRADGPRGTSRTDAGVHARAQIAAFDTDREMPARGWVLTLNRELPEDVAVRWAAPAPAGLDPRGISRGKRYVYEITRDRVRDPLLARRAWRVGAELDVECMMREAACAVGTHDFAAFRTAADERVDTVRTLSRVEVIADARSRRLRVEVEGTAFLHNMVRILVGSLVDVGRGTLDPGAVSRALASRDRRDLGQTAPPDGLTLDEVFLDPAHFGARWPA